VGDDGETSPAAFYLPEGEGKFCFVGGNATDLAH